MTEKAGWKSRIVDQGEADPEQLLANPRNWRIHPKHQQDALAAALDDIGWVQNVIVNTTTGHVVDGHLRVAVSLSRGEKTVPVTYVELTPEEEHKALATLDPIAALAVTDEGALKGLKADLEGLLSDELDALLTDLTPGGGVDDPLFPSQGDIDKRKTELDDQMRELGHERVVDVNCPSCGQEFGVKLSDLLEPPDQD